MTDTELKELIEDCCNEIANKIEPLANVKARLYTSLKPAINYTRCSTQLKDKEAMTFESWVVENKETETYNAFLQGGFSFSLGDLYIKYAESLNKPLIV